MRPAYGGDLAVGTGSPQSACSTRSREKCCPCCCCSRVQTEPERPSCASARRSGSPSCRCPPRKVSGAPGSAHRGRRRTPPRRRDDQGDAQRQPQRRENRLAVPPAKLTVQVREEQGALQGSLSVARAAYPFALRGTCGSPEHKLRIEDASAGVRQASGEHSVKEASSAEGESRQGGMPCPARPLFAWGRCCVARRRRARCRPPGRRHVAAGKLDAHAQSLRHSAAACLIKGGSTTLVTDPAQSEALFLGGAAPLALAPAGL